MSPLGTAACASRSLSDCWGAALTSTPSRGTPTASMTAAGPSRPITEFVRESRHAAFFYDLRGRFSVAGNDEAQWLLGDQRAPGVRSAVVCG